jgi:hypothetical protein
VTRRIKGERKMVIEIAALAGKGYSAPVGFGAGKERPRARGGELAKTKQLNLTEQERRDVVEYLKSL